MAGLRARLVSELGGLELGPPDRFGKLSHLLQPVLHHYAYWCWTRSRDLTLRWFSLVKGISVRDLLCVE